MFNFDLATKFTGADVGEFGLAMWQRVSADRRQAQARDK